MAECSALLEKVDPSTLIMDMPSLQVYVQNQDDMPKSVSLNEAAELSQKWNPVSDYDKLMHHHISYSFTHFSGESLKEYWDL